MDAQTAVRQQLTFWHATLDSMVAECSPEVLNKSVGGTTTSIGSIYAHVVLAEDVITHVSLQGKEPLYQAQGWESKVGIPFPGVPPAMTPAWAASVKMDLPPFQEYAKSVYKAVDAYMGSVGGEDFDKRVGESQYTVGFYIVNILGTHAPQHAGEVAALKGVLGLKGLPF